MLNRNGEGMENYKEYLKNLIYNYLHTKADDAIIKYLSDNSSVKTFKKNELVIAAGDASSKLFVLYQGLIRKFYLDYQGNDITHMFITPDSVFSTEFIMVQTPALCSFEALEECVLLQMDYKKVRQKMMEETQLMQVYIRILEETLREKLLRDNSLLGKCATERYLELKHRMPDIDKRVNHTHIASYIGVTPVSLSRIRRTLREEN